MSLERPDEQMNLPIEVPHMLTDRVRVEAFPLKADDGETQRGRRVSLDLLEELRALLDQLSPSAQMKLAAVAMAYGTGMSERTAMLAIERVEWVRREHGWRDPDILRALQPLPVKRDTAWG